jgi:hypothetical protein
MKTEFLITGLLLLLVANLIMVYASTSEGFAAPSIYAATAPGAASAPEKKKAAAEGFASYFLENGAAAGSAYQPIGAFDNVRLTTGNGVNSWRFTAPNEPLLGPEFQPGPDSLFIFKNNQAKPECCDASFATDTGCVCVTQKQRDYINMRGGNRGMEDSF